MECYPVPEIGIGAQSMTSQKISRGFSGPGLFLAISRAILAIALIGQGLGALLNAR
jgi:hypothetical protein